MNVKIFRLMLCVFLSLSVMLLSGCDRVRNIVGTDEMIPTPDTDTMPTLKVGVIRHSDYIDFAQGAELARQQINAAGGVLGRQLEFVVKVETTDTVAQTAIDFAEMGDVVGIVGPLFSSHAVKVGPVATIPVLAGATGKDVTETGDFIFIVGASNALQAELMANFAVDELGAKTAGIIWQNQDVYSGGFVEEFSANFVKLGGSVVAKEVYEPGDTMFDAQLERIKAVTPDVLFLASFPPEVPLIMEQARAVGITSTFIGSDGWDVAPFHTMIMDKSLLTDSYYCSNFHRTQAVEFVSAFEAMFPETSAGGVAAGGYDAVRLLVQGIENAQSTDPVAVRDAIANIMDYEGATIISHFRANDNGQKRESNNSAVVVRGEDRTVYPYGN